MKKLSLFGLFLLTLFACRQDIDTMGGSSFQDDPPVIIDRYTPTMNLITGTVTGIVYDEQDNPIENAIIKLRGDSFTTDDEGFFVAKDVEIDAEGTFYTVEKDGYFKGSRRFYPRDGAVNYTRVQLMALNNIGTVVAANGGTVTGDDDLQLVFPANGIKKADGTLYEGDVEVAAKWLDPSADNVTELMPGALFGLNSKIEEVALATFGMVAVELFGENGEKLNVADGKTVEISFPLPTEMLASAPDEIPLWSFEDEEYGIWVEEGSATLQNGKYVGAVRHFSFWNCDAPFPIVFVEGRLVTENGTPIADASVKVSVPGLNVCRYGYTDSDGYFGGKMPKDQILDISAGFGNQTCAFASSSIGPFSDDTNIGDLTLLDSGSSFEITGSVVDCMGNPVTDGRVKVTVGNKLTTLYLDGDNTFTMAVLNCDNATEFSIRADDLPNQEGSMGATFPIAATVDVGSIAACGTVITEFFTLTVDGNSKTFNDGYVQFESPNTGDFLYMNINDLNPGADSSYFNLSMESGAIGTYDDSGLWQLNINTFMPSFPSELYLFCNGNQGTGGCMELTSFSMDITVNEGLGGNHEGTITGVADFTDNTGATVPGLNISASWRLPIVQ